MTLDISPTGPEIFAQETLAGFQSPANPFICLRLIYGLILTVSYMQMLGEVMVLEGVVWGAKGEGLCECVCVLWGGGLGWGPRFLEIYIM